MPHTLLTSRAVIGGLVALSVTFGIRPVETQAPQAVFPSGVDVVTVDVVVFDKQGNPVDGLTQADFTVKENGERQRVAAFQAINLSESAAVPRTHPRVSTNAAGIESPARWFFIVFDDANISTLATPRARDTIVQFIDRSLRAGDHVMIASSASGARWTGRLPEDRGSLVAFISRLQGAHRPDTSAARMWDHEALAIVLGRDRLALAQVARRYFENNLIPEAYPNDPERSKELDVSPGLPMIQAKARQTYTEVTARLRASLGTLDRISSALAQARGRKTLLLVSEGFIMDTTQTEFRALVQSARNSNTAVHFVDVRSPEGMVGQAGQPGGSAEAGASVFDDRDATTQLAFAAREADGARSVALDTGGRVVTGTNLLDGLARIAAEARSYYLLGYTPTNRKRDGKFRKIEVTLNRPDLEVRARGGYYAPSDKESPRPAPDKLHPAVRAGLDAPFDADGIPLRLTSYVFGRQADGRVQTTLVAEADPSPLRLQAKDGRHSGILESYVLVHGRDSGELQRDERLVELNLPAEALEQARRTGVPIRREFALAPGRYQATLLLRDRTTGLLGSVRHEFEVPADAFRISSPILTDVVQSAGAGQPERPVPVARRTFAAGSRLLCAFDIYGAALDTASASARVTLAYSLRRADGTEAAAAPPRALRSGPQGQVTVAIALTLPADAAGPHELALKVTDELTGRTIDYIEPLEVNKP